MRPYGVKVEEYPDVADIKEMGSASHTGKLPGKSGDFHPYCKGKSKRRSRRYWKRVARAENKAACKEEID